MKLEDGQSVTRVTDTPGLRVPDQRDQSASLLLPPAQEQKVMIMGGGETYSPAQYATNTTDEIKLDEPSPHWVPGPDLPRGTMEEGGAMEPMGAGKMYVSAVALPNGMVLETGGSLIPRTENVLEASIFNPRTNSFTSVAHDPVGRDYHSEALLLPDGRVMTLGSNPANSNGEESFETRISIYTPSYLTAGAEAGAEPRRRADEPTRRIGQPHHAVGLRDRTRPELRNRPRRSPRPCSSGRPP